LTKIQELENKADAAELQCKHQEMKLESFTSLPSVKNKKEKLEFEHELLNII